MDKPLPNHGGLLLDMYDNVKFSRDAVERFPQLREELEAEADLLHVQMATLAKAVLSWVSSGQTALALDVCAFVDEALGQPRAISEIENAVAISFVQLGDLRAAAGGGAVLRQLPIRVRRVLVEQEAREKTSSEGAV